MPWLYINAAVYFMDKCYILKALGFWGVEFFSFRIMFAVKQYHAARKDGQIKGSHNNPGTGTFD